MFNSVHVCTKAGFGLLLVALLSILGAPLFAQGQSQAQVTAQLSSGVVKLGSEVILIATIQNAAFSDVRPLPAVDGLRLGPWSNPSSRQMISSINGGRPTRLDEKTWTAVVRPERKGEFTIPGLEFSVDGSVARTQPLALTVVEDLKGEELGVFGIRASTHKVVEGEPFTIEMNFGWDMALKERINWANLSLPWWGKLPGAIENAPPPLAAGVSQVELILNTTETIRVEVLPKTTIRGRAFQMYRLVRSFTPTRSGALEFPSSWLEFARVEDSGDIFSRRREKVESFFVKSEPLTIDVIELPEAGRPPDFGGAIGKFNVRATAAPRDVDAGESIKLKIEWTGAGNLEFFSVPEPSRSDAFHGFRVYGKTETKTFDRRSVTYDIAPRSAEVKLIPPIVLPVFDPESGSYTSVSTEPITINVRALSRVSGLSDSASGFVAQNDLRDVDRKWSEAGDLPRPGRTTVFFAFGLLPFLWIAMARVARRRGDPWAPLERRRRRAKAQLARELAQADSPRAELGAVQNFLGARTAEVPEAWQGRDLREWFARHSIAVEPEVIRELQGLIAELEAATWGGARRPAQSSVRERALSVADRLVRGGL
ncbi:MAG TPA: BatD family protein [Planctomycetota bacterium]|nr:BatD family protein [Planctomycetota bacterium]